MRRLVARLFVFAALVTLAACGSESATDAGPVSVAGTYTLRTVNGAPLPYTIVQIGTDKIEITADAVTLKEGGTWTESWTERATESGKVTTSTNTDAGTYTRTGTAITLVSPESGTVAGSLDGGTLSLNQQGFVTVYSK